MNEQLQQALASILGKTMQGVEAGVSFLSTEIPDVIHQLLVWKMYYAGLESIALIFGLIAFYKFCKFYEKTEGDFFKEYGTATPPAIIIFIVGGIYSLLSCAQLFLNIATMFKIWLAPKIYLIEYAASLAK